MGKKDMYLPLWVCFLGVFLLLISIYLFLYPFVGPDKTILMRPDKRILYLFGFAAGLGLGVSALLCWKNQWIVMLNDEEFVYSTMFAKQIRYRFSQIKGVRIRRGSTRLMMETGVVFIDSAAVISDRLRAKIEHAWKETASR